MKKTLGIILAAAFLLAAPFTTHAQAQEPDTTSLTCAELFGVTEALDLTMIYVWLDGYVSAQTGNKYLDFDEIGAALKAIAGPCAANPDTLIVDMIKQQQ